MTPMIPSAPLELWGGVECTVNRVGDCFRDQLAMTGHDEREGDLERFANLGLRTLRFPVLWERTAPGGLEHADWAWPDARLARARELGIRPIVGLVHHGSGPAGTNLLDPAFPELLATYARAVAERYPWVTAYTPVNEPLTTARFSALYGLWYPHAQADHDLVRAVLGQCRASVLAMRAIREINPDAVFVQTEDLGRTYSTPLLEYQANFDNDRRWLTFDLLAGRLTPRSRMWRHMRDLGVPEATLHWFGENGCRPDILGINHYLTSNRYLDSDLDHYPADTWGGNGRHRYADVAAVRVLTSSAGVGDLLTETWTRYRIPVAVTEAHLGCTREEQLRWLHEVWQASNAVRETGVDVRAVTAWSLLGSFDWNSLLTQNRAHYEPGAFDVRAPVPRLTAVGRMIGELAQGRPASHPVTRQPGWWRSGSRFAYGHEPTETSHDDWSSAAPPSRPILITGSGGTLGSAIGRLAELRGLDTRLLRRADLDIADPDALASALAEFAPWAVVNAAGYARVNAAESDPDTCFRENADGPATLARECERLGISLVTFSSDLVFSGRPGAQYVESDPVNPANVYGASKVEAERRVARLMPSALVIRTSALFGAWESDNLLTRALRELHAGRHWAVPAAVVSPTYLPDLVNATLDLLIDAERGVWHLASRGSMSWLELVRRAAGVAGVDTRRLREVSVPSATASCVLGTERGVLLPPIEEALVRYADELGVQTARHTVPSPARPAAGA